MNSRIASERIDTGLNKLDSRTHSWINNWHKETALNKAQNDWFRRQMHGMNVLLEGDEESRQRVDDLQHLLKSKELTFTKVGKHYATEKLPDDYRYFKRVTPTVGSGNCALCLKSTLVEEANVDEYLTDFMFQPSLDFEETFHTICDNKIHLYHNGDFEADKIDLKYYRNPKMIRVPEPEEEPNIDAILEEEWEWKDDTAEVIIDEAISILAGNVEDTFHQQLSTQRVQNNN